MGDNPRGHRLYKENISKVISKPSLDDTSSIYQDGDIGFSGYTSETNLANASDQDSVAGIGSEVSGAMNEIHIKAPKKYKNKYANKIRNFNPSADTLEIDGNNFKIDDSPTFTS